MFTMIISKDNGMREYNYQTKEIGDWANRLHPGTGVVSL